LWLVAASRNLQLLVAEVVPPLSSGDDAAITMLGAATTGNRMTTSHRGATSGQAPAANGMRAVDRWGGGEYL
jgi:hypothetical protein